MCCTFVEAGKRDEWQTDFCTRCSKVRCGWNTCIVTRTVKEEREVVERTIRRDNREDLVWWWWWW
jgi:hypothetical protein